nr:ankyrin repeat domain-containing protein [Parashewanella hymeniacidonis]
MRHLNSKAVLNDETINSFDDEASSINAQETIEHQLSEAENTDITENTQLTELKNRTIDYERDFSVKYSGEQESSFCDSPKLNNFILQPGVRKNLNHSLPITEDQFIETLLDSINSGFKLFQHCESLLPLEDKQEFLDESLLLLPAEQQSYLLQYAIKHSKVSLIESLISTNFTEGPVDKQGNTLLHLALLNGDRDVVELVAKYNSRSNEIKNCIGNTPLGIAFINGDKEVIKILLKYTNIGDLQSTLPPYHETILSLVVKLEDADILKLTLRQSSTTEGQAYEAAFLLSAQLGFHHGIVIFVKHGVSINSTNESNQTALTLAVKRNDLNTCNTLIKWGATFASSKPQGSSLSTQALMIRKKIFPQDVEVFQISTLYQIQQMELDAIAHVLFGRIVEFPLAECILYQAIKDGDSQEALNILKTHPDLTLECQDECQNTLLHLAIESCDKSVVEALIFKGADIHSVTNADNFTPLELAVYLSKYDIVSIMMNHKHTFDINRPRTAKHNSPSRLEMAMICERTEIMRFLLENGAEVDTFCSGSQPTPLLCAVMAQNTSAIHLLAEFGADFTRSDKQGRSVFQLCALYKKPKLFDTLLILCPPNPTISKATLLDSGLGKNELEVLRRACKLKLSNITRFILKREPSSTIPEIMLFDKLKKRKSIVDVSVPEYVTLITELTDELGNTILHYAVQSGVPESIETVLNLGAKVHSTINNDGLTPTQLAVTRKDETAISLLLDKICYEDINLQTQNEYDSLLNMALQADAQRLVNALYRSGADLNIRFRDKNNTPLMVAAINGQTDIMKFFLKKGADPELTNNSGLTALELAFQHKRVICCNVLLCFGAKPCENLTRKIYELGIGENPLDVVKYFGTHELSGFLNIYLNSLPNIPIAELTILELAKNNRSNKQLKQILDVVHLKLNFKTPAGQTALHIASLHGANENIKLLGMAGADANAVEDFQGYTPLQKAVATSNQKAIDALLEYCPIREIDAISKRGNWTCMSLCIEKGGIKTAQKLLKHGASVNSGNTITNTPIYVAILNKRSAAVQWLCQNGVDFDIRIVDEPLSHFAAKMNHYETFQALIKAGLDLSLTNFRRETVYQVAKDHNCTNVLWLIRTEIALRNEKAMSTFEEFEVIDESTTKEFEASQVTST